jgi:selenoprotein W-related protein
VVESTTKVTITYCTQCNWLLRASWMAGELLQTFVNADLGEVALRPGTGGIFTVHAMGPGTPRWTADGEAAVAESGGKERIGGKEQVGGDEQVGGKERVGGKDQVERGAILVWDRKADGGFPDIVDLKRRVRDIIAPDLVLGHADRAAAKAKRNDEAGDPGHA